MVVDAGLGLLTLLVVALTVARIRRAGRWSLRRATWPRWRFCLRLLPQTIGPILAILVFRVLPSLARQGITPVDAFAVWPAAMVLLLALAASGATLILTRGAHRATGKHSDTDPSPTA